MSQIARTDATGAGSLHPRVVALTSSLSLDRHLLTEDVLGSVAHALGLCRAGLLTSEEARTLRAGLWSVLSDPTSLPEEEDVHMAVESLLSTRLGAVSGKLHTGRSRNDQVALDIALRLREEARLVGESLLLLLEKLSTLADDGANTLLPGYTHRQRAIPITVGHWAAAAMAPLVRDGEWLGFLLPQLDRCPLGAGALAGSSLPLDRPYVAALLGFRCPTENSLDTVGDRDGTQDLCYLSARLHNHMSRIATDVIDFATREFRLVRLGDAIAGGSSMMPHKKNPDVFELVRGRAPRAQGDLMASLSLTKGLPLGYQRDLQEDRATLLTLGPHLRGTLELLTIGLGHITFDGETAEAALRADATQATDLAEVLVSRGLPFRTAYRLVGALVSKSRDQGLLSLSDEDLQTALPPDLREDKTVLADLRRRLDPRACVEARDLPGGPAPTAVQTQVVAFRARMSGIRKRLTGIETLSNVRARLENEEI